LLLKTLCLAWRPSWSIPSSNTREELLARFDAIPGKKGMCILIWNIRRYEAGVCGKAANKSHYGIMMYCNNWLIRCEKVGCQRKTVIWKKKQHRLQMGGSSLSSQTDWAIREYLQTDLVQLSNRQGGGRPEQDITANV
ncbi:LOW QUALITY PROTEIN: MORC family CW-type zinc finger protein 4, partial [Theristicus caerulescens]